MMKVHQEGKQVRELWVTDWPNVEGGSEVVGIFEDMADFFNELMDSIPNIGQDGTMGDPAFEHLPSIPPTSSPRRLQTPQHDAVLISVQRAAGQQGGAPPP